MISDVDGSVNNAKRTVISRVSEAARLAAKQAGRGRRLADARMLADDRALGQ